MKVLFSILFNAFILYAMAYFLAANPAMGITEGIEVVGGLKTYIFGGIILGIINVFIKPILKILTLPLFFVFLGFVTFIINGTILWLFDFIINDILMIAGISYNIVGWINFIIAVAIFTILNMFYSLLFSKK